MSTSQDQSQAKKDISSSGRTIGSPKSFQKLEDKRDLKIGNRSMVFLGSGITDSGARIKELSSPNSENKNTVRSQTRLSSKGSNLQTPLLNTFNNMESENLSSKHVEKEDSYSDDQVDFRLPEESEQENSLTDSSKESELSEDLNMGPEIAGIKLIAADTIDPSEALRNLQQASQGTFPSLNKDPDPTSPTNPEESPDLNSNPKEGPTPVEGRQKPPRALITTTSVLILCLTYLLTTLTLRDLFFLSLGVLSSLLIYYYFYTREASKKNSRSRVVVSFDELKRHFNASLEKVNWVYFKRKYFINEYSKDGIYRQIGQEEEVDVTKWIEHCEEKLSKEATERFSLFEKAVREGQGRADEVSKEVKRDSAHEGVTQEFYHGEKVSSDHNKDDNPLLNEDESPTSKVRENGPDLGIKDPAELLNKAQPTAIKEINQTQLKAILEDMPTILSDYYKTVEKSVSNMSSFNNQMFAKFKKMFDSSINSAQLKPQFFALEYEEFEDKCPWLLKPESLLREYVELKEPESNFNFSFLFDSTWEDFKEWLQSIHGKLVGNQLFSSEESLTSIANFSQECLSKVEDSTKNARKLRDFFDRSRLELQKEQAEFNQKIEATKQKISEYKKSIKEKEGFEKQLKLEYEIRISINRVYELKNSYESLYSSLERRLEFVELFNTNIQEMNIKANSEVLNVFEFCENKLLQQAKEISAIKLTFIFNIVQKKFPVHLGEEDKEGPDWNTLQQIFKGKKLKEEETEDVLKLKFPVNESDFKNYLSSFILHPGVQKSGMTEQSLLETESKKVSEMIESFQSSINSIKADLGDIELDDMNQMEECITINAIRESKAPLMDRLSPKANVSQSINLQGFNRKTSSDSKYNKADWSNNRDKQEKLKNMLETHQKCSEELLDIFNEKLSSVIKNETRLDKFTQKYTNEQIKKWLFLKLSRYYLGHRLSLQILVNSLTAIFDFSKQLIEESIWIKKQCLSDSEIESKMNTQTKKTIFRFLQTLKTAEICSRSLIIELISLESFREFHLIELLLNDTYPDFLSQQPKSYEEFLDVLKKIEEGSLNRLMTFQKEDFEEDLKIESSVLMANASRYLEKDELELKKMEKQDSGSVRNLHGSPVKMQPLQRGSAGLNNSQTLKAPSSNKTLSLALFNQFMKTLFEEWSVNPYFTKYASRKLQKKFNRDRPMIFEEFVVTSFRMAKTPIKIKSVKEHKHERFEFLCDMDLEYDGLIAATIETNVLISTPLVKYL